MSEKCKGITALTGILFILILLAVLVMQVGYRKADEIYYNQMAAIVGELSQEEVKTAIKAMKETNEETINQGKVILEQYGYSDESLTVSSNREGFQAVMGAAIFLVFIIFILGIMAIWWIYKRFRSKLDKLLDYLTQMANGNYEMNIENINEGKYSLFEDTIYKATIALREGKEQAEKEKLLMAKNLADISHQLKTPLTSMGIMVDILLENEEDEQNRHFIERLSSQIDRLSHLVGILLKLAKLDSGTLKLQNKKINVQELIEEVIEDLGIQIKEKHQHIQLNLQQTAYFIGDFTWSFEAFTNIINNCVQHTPYGGIIQVTCTQNPIYTEIIIEDEGKGVLKEDLPHLFERFYRGKNASKESVGIGLAMAKTIIEKQNGEIRAHNTNEGLAFTVKFY